jgi:hypothetical protein
MFSTIKKFAGKALKAVKKVAKKVGKGVKTAALYVAKKVKQGWDKVVEVAKVAYEFAAEQTAKVGISLPTVAAYAGAGVAVAGTVALVTVGLPAVVVPAIGLGLMCWLGRDLYKFLTGYQTSSAQAEAALRVSVVVLTGTVTLAALVTNPIMGAVIVSCVAMSLMYKVVCSEAGRYDIEQRHEPLPMNCVPLTAAPTGLLPMPTV